MPNIGKVGSYEHKNAIPPGANIAPYDAAEFLRSPEDIEAYLEAIFEECGNDTPA